MTHIFSKSSHISHLADLEISKRGSILKIGDDSTIDSFVKIKFSGGIGDIIIGNRCHINSGCVLYSGNGINMGDNVIIAANCVFAPTNHQYTDINIPIRDQGFKASKGGILIEENVWIGAGSVILDGAIIRKGSIIAAMSLVRNVIEANSIYAGNPIRFVKKRNIL